MIQQHLHEIQHRFGYLPADELRRLATQIGVPLHRLHEVASCFPGYRLKPPPGVEVKVCRDMSCHLRGAERLEAQLKALAAEIGGPGRNGAAAVAVEGVSCLGQCDQAPAIVIGHGPEDDRRDYVYRGLSDGEYVNLIRRANIGELIERQEATRQRPPWKIDPYEGGPANYEAVRRLAQASDFEAEANRLIGAIQVANLRGMGGARFPTATKWGSVRKEPATPKYVVCNADECEPGTFKDRDLMRRTPHLLVEGMILAGLVVGAEHGWVYIRHEYEEEIEAMREAIADARSRGFCGQDILGTGRSYELDVYVSPGGYICGEESALIEAMEDRRAEPRNKPPFPYQNGLFSKPTVINNVETLMWTPAIALKGGEWYRDQGVNGGQGLWFCSISGDVNDPGVYEIPFGLTVGDLIDKYAGGMRGGQKLKAIAPSGPSSGYLPAMLKGDTLPTEKAKQFFREKLSPDGAPYDIRKLPLDYTVLTGIGNMLGAAFVAVGEKACVVDMAANTTQFFRNESCGKCVPCRVGSQKLADLFAEITQRQSSPARLALAAELTPVMEQTSICGLGMVAPNPMRTLLWFFREELDEHIQRGRCAAGVCWPNV